MSIAESLESFLLNAEARTGQKTVELQSKMKKKIGEGRFIFFSLSKSFKSKKEDR